MLLAVFFFGVAHAAVKWLPHIPFFELAVWRQGIALSIAIYLIYKAKISPWGTNRPMLVFRGVMGTMALTSYFYCLQNMPLATAVTLQYLSPILTLVVARYMLSERLDQGIAKYFVLAFIGLLLVKGVDQRVSYFALGVSLFSVFASAFAYNSVRALGANDHELVIVFYFPLVSLPILTPLSLHAWVWPEGMDWIFIFIIGVFTFIAQLFMTQSYKVARAQDVAIYNYLGIFIALAFGFIFFNETYDFISYSGMFIILLAVYLATYKRRSSITE
jgi:drug/metabolite transporter (DMT)-like permease